MDLITLALCMKRIGQGIPAAVSDYLDEHLTNPTDPPIDTSLSIAGAAADSKATGDKLSELKEDLSEIESDLYEFVSVNLTVGGFIGLGVGIGNEVSLTPVSNAGYTYAVIDCKKGDTFELSAKGGSNSRAWGFIDSDNKLLSVANASAYAQNITLTASHDGKFIVNAYIYDTTTYPYYLRESAPKTDGIIGDISNIENEIGKINETSIVLPNAVYGVVGHEFNLYKGNALIYGDIDSVADVKYMAFLNNYFETKKRLSCTPTAIYNDVPRFSLFRHSIKERDEFKNLRLIVKDPSILSGKTRDIVIIGDSKVNGGRLPRVFKDLCTECGMIVGDLKGSIYSENFFVRHEGRAGWSSSDYFTASKGNVTNAFYNNGTFDFSYWMNQQGYSNMDYVFINLGTNDYGNNLGSLDYINTFIGNINNMIASIHEYDSNIKVIIGLAEGVCTYKWSNGDDNYLRNQNTRARLLNDASIKAWDTTAAKNNNVWVCPIYLSMDMENDYVMEEVPLSEWDQYFETGKTRYNVTDTMHQNAVGYAKNATYMFAVMTYIESLSA